MRMKAMKHVAEPTAKVGKKKTVRVKRKVAAKAGAKAMKAVPTVAQPVALTMPVALAGKELEFAKAKAAAKQFGEDLEQISAGLDTTEQQEVLNELHFAFLHEKVYLK